jgi:mono/diheme cytochrome c family protein
MFIRVLKIASPFFIVVLLAIFVLNIYTHATVEHPGKVFYKVKCAQCHGDNGEGIRSLVPPITKTFFSKENIDSIPCWLKFGMNQSISVNGVLYDQTMYPNKIDEVQTANVVNYILQDFLHSDSSVNAEWVKACWKTCR